MSEIGPLHIICEHLGKIPIVRLTRCQEYKISNIFESTFNYGIETLKSKVQVDWIGKWTVLILFFDWNCPSEHYLWKDIQNSHISIKKGSKIQNTYCNLSLDILMCSIKWLDWLVNSLDTFFYWNWLSAHYFKKYMQNSQVSKDMEVIVTMV